MFDRLFASVQPERTAVNWHLLIIYSYNSLLNCLQIKDAPYSKTVVSYVICGNTCWIERCKDRTDIQAHLAAQLLYILQRLVQAMRAQTVIGDVVLEISLLPEGTQGSSSTVRRLEVRSWNASPVVSQPNRL